MLQYNIYTTQTNPTQNNNDKEFLKRTTNITATYAKENHSEGMVYSKQYAFTNDSNFNFIF